ncbi:MAG: hypothetical protein V5A16_07170 [Haloplanus sp.]
MVPTRRTLCRLAASTTLAGLAGCLDGLRSGNVAVRVDNRDDGRHAVDVEFLSGGDLVAEERYEVAAGAEQTYENVVGAGEYTVEIALDGGPETRVPFTMQGCADNTLFISIDADARMDASVLDEC